MRVHDAGTRRLGAQDQLGRDFSGPLIPGSSEQYPRRSMYGVSPIAPKSPWLLVAPEPVCSTDASGAAGGT